MARKQGVVGHSVVLAPLANANGRLVPVVLVGDGEPLVSGVDWLSTKNYTNQSSTRINEAARALGLLHDYYSHAHVGQVMSSDSVKKLLEEFADALLFGTVNASDGSCPFGLWWEPLGYEQAQRYARHAERYCQHIFANDKIAAPTQHEKRMLVYVRSAWQWQTAAGGVLAHLKRSRHSHDDDGGGTPDPRSAGQGAAGMKERPIPFPENMIIRMLTEGCRRAKELRDPSLPPYLRQYNVRNQLAFLMLFGLGLRSEELFHVFPTDIYVGTDGIARVNLYHPRRGAFRWTPPGSRKEITETREDYLRKRYNLRPRNMYNKKERQWAGWKQLLLQYGAPQWFARGYWIHPNFGKWFWDLHCLYIKYYRGSSPDVHPYYFISLDKSNYGEIWTMKAFQSAWQDAIEKIGMLQDRAMGTNPHAARHFYGQRAADMGIDPRIRQVMMHHTNIVSQLRYQMPTPDQVDAHLTRGLERMIKRMEGNTIKEAESEKISNFPADSIDSFLASGTKENHIDNDLYHIVQGMKVDPLRVISSWNLFNSVGG